MATATIEKPAIEGQPAVGAAAETAAAVASVTAPPPRRRPGLMLRWLLPMVGGLIWGYMLFVRPWQRRWGATDEEVERPMPGDDLVDDPRNKGTRAITVNAPAQEIWPWLVQLGQGRGGWYSYEWLERILKLNIRNARDILPDFQNLKVGDVIPTGAPGLDIPVLALEANRSMLLGGSEATISIGLYPLDEEHTRLVVRSRNRFSGSLSALFWSLLMDPGEFVMWRGMLVGVKKRAERRRQARRGRGEPRPHISQNGHFTLVESEKELVAVG